jgi:hypothetical protein
MTLEAIAGLILNEGTSKQRLREALDAYSRRCSTITGIVASPSFDGWSQDAHLDTGVAINPQAAAHCISDYRRTVVFIRAVHEALAVARLRFGPGSLRILYAGCGPFATLLLPLLGAFRPGELEIVLLDMHRASLDAVQQLILEFGFDTYNIQCLQADASDYQHPLAPQVIIAETMQKALEQEPQVAVTMNLAPQLCAGGIFVPQSIAVELGLAHLQGESETFAREQTIDVDRLVKEGQRIHLGKLIELTAERAKVLVAEGHCDEIEGRAELKLARVDIPKLPDIGEFDLLLFTRISAFGRHRLADYESEITLPLKCHDLPVLRGGESIVASYQLGGYPKICLR